MKGYGWASAAAVFAVALIVVLVSANHEGSARGWFVPLAAPSDGLTEATSTTGSPTESAAAPKVPVPAASAPEAAAATDGNVAPLGGTSPADADRVSPVWARTAAARTGIPERAVLAYSGASLALAEQQPLCHLGWTTLAALGAIESGHATHAGSHVGDDGVVRPGIFGARLDGGVYGAVADTDGGRLDGDKTWDRAVGPLQFIPSTWARWGADGNGDSVADPQQLDDAALAAGRYLCSYGDLSAPRTWRTAVFAYNHLDSYVDSVADIARSYDRVAG